MIALAPHMDTRLAALALLVPSDLDTPEDFTFVQISDTHVAVRCVGDRGFERAWHSLTGEMHKLPFENVAAIGRSIDGEHVNPRGKDDVLTRIDHDGKVVWTKKVALARFPCAPTEIETMFGVGSERGLLSWIDTTDRRVRAQYPSTAGAYVMFSIEGVFERVVRGAENGPEYFQNANGDIYFARARAADGTDASFAYTRT